METLNRGLLAKVVVIALLVTAQFGAAVHAFEHDLDTPQVKVCGTCIAASQLGSACIGAAAPIDLPQGQHVLVAVACTGHSSATFRAPNQRGPPAALA